MTDKSGLNDRQLAAVTEYLATGKVEKGSKAGGFRQNAWVNNTKVRAFIWQKLQERIEKSEVTADFVKFGLVSVYERAMQLETVGEGEKAHFVYEPQVALQALKMLGDFFNCWGAIPGLPPAMPGGPTRVIESVSFQRIRERIARVEEGAAGPPPPVVSEQ